MASKTPPQQSKRKIDDVTKPDVAADIKTPQIVIEKRSRMQSPAEEAPATDTQATPTTTAHTAVKSITPLDADTESAAETPAAPAATAEVVDKTPAAADTAPTKEEPTTEPKPTEVATTDKPQENTKAQVAEKPKPAPSQAAPATDDIAAGSDGAASDNRTTGEKSDAVKDAEAKRQQEAEDRRKKQLKQYIDTKEFFVPINAAARKRSIEVSLWLTFIYIILSVVLVDLMLDSGMIELLQKVPHTNFFST